VLHIRFILFSSLTLIISCQSLNERYLEYLGKVEVAEYPGRRTEIKKQILLEKISAKTGSFNNNQSIIFTENLKFQLIQKGYKVETLAELGLGETPNSGNGLLEKSSSDPSVLSKNALEGCKKISCDLIISGYLFENKLGNILDEKASVGIILFSRNNEGLLNSEFRYSGDKSLEVFQFNLIIAKLFSKQISDHYEEKKDTKNFFKL
jgi:hypothetical protein